MHYICFHVSAFSAIVERPKPGNAVITKSVFMLHCKLQQFHGKIHIVKVHLGFGDRLYKISNEEQET